MELKVNIKGRYFFVFGTFLIVLAGVLFVRAQVTSTNPWHDASSIEVTIGGQTRSLQQAIDQNLLYQPTVLPPSADPGLQFIGGGLKAAAAEANLGSGWDVAMMLGSYSTSDGCYTGGFIYDVGTEVRASLHSCNSELNFALGSSNNGPPNLRILARREANGDIILAGSERISYVVLE